MWHKRRSGDLAAKIRRWRLAKLAAVAHLNRCEFIGILLTEIELSYTSNEVPMAKALLWVRRDNQKSRRHAIKLWIHAWGRLAEIWYEWQRRKDWLYVAGSLRMDFHRGSWRPYIGAETIQFLYPRPTANLKGGHYLMPADLVERFNRFQQATDELQVPPDALSIWEINKIVADQVNPDIPMLQRREDVTDQTLDEHLGAGEDQQITRDTKSLNRGVRKQWHYGNLSNMAGFDDSQLEERVLEPRSDEPERDPGQ